MSAEPQPLSTAMVELLREAAVPDAGLRPPTTGGRMRTAVALVNRGFATIFRDRVFITQAGRFALTTHDRIFGEVSA